MSYDLGLFDNDQKPVQVERHTEGGTLVLGGTTDAELNITYNYGRFYYEWLDEEQGLRWLYGKSGAETTERLTRAIAVLGIYQDEDYWKGTPGNAGYALTILLSWAAQYPDAIWDGD